METWTTELRFYIAPLVAAVGMLTAARGVRRSREALGQTPGAAGKNLRLMSGFRQLIVGSAVALVALSWALQSVAVVATAGIIGAGELFETSLDIWALQGRTWTYGSASSPRRQDTM